MFINYHPYVEHFWDQMRNDIQNSQFQIIDNDCALEVSNIDHNYRRLIVSFMDNQHNIYDVSIDKLARRDWQLTAKRNNQTFFNSNGTGIATLWNDFKNNVVAFQYIPQHVQNHHINHHQHVQGIPQQNQQHNLPN